MSKFRDKLESIGIILFSLLIDFIVVYSCIYILTTPAIPFYWIFPILLITVPILYFINKGAVECLKKWLKKEK